jgi:hypothetical protein
VFVVRVEVIINEKIKNFERIYFLKKYWTLYLKMDIINHYKTLYGDLLEISEYFYQYRKIWKDMVPRIKKNQFKNIQEKLKNIENRNLI